MNKLGFGLMRLPLTDESISSSVDMEKTFEMVDEFMKAGFNYFDTAYMYHGDESEVVARNAIVERYPRENFTLTDKMPIWYVKKEEELEEYFQKQLGKCGVTYFDYYLLHGLDRENYELSKNFRAFEYLEQLKRRNLIKKSGISFHSSAALLEEILENYGNYIDVVQIQLNYLDWNSENIQSKECYEICVKYGKPVIVMEPLRGGNLVSLTKEQEAVLREMDGERSNASWGVDFAASLPQVFMVLSGMSTIEQVRENCKNIHEFAGLKEEEKEALEEVANLIRLKKSIPCTGCNYCVDGCPIGIPIPEYFKLYNEEDRDGWQGEVSLKIEKFADTHPRPDECLECGQCEKVCPQHINIIRNLKKRKG